METLGPFKGLYRGYIGVILGNGKENGNYYSILVFCVAPLGIPQKKGGVFRQGFCVGMYICCVSYVSCGKFIMLVLGS